MKIKPVVLLLTATLALALVLGLIFVLLTRLESLTKETLLALLVILLGLIIALSVLLRGETRRSERAVRQALEALGFERENWLSRQYRGNFGGCEYEILPFFTKGYGDVLALQILLRGAFQPQLVLALPRGLSDFVVWEAERGGQIKPEGYAGYLVYAPDRQAAQAGLAQPEIEGLLKDLFKVSSQTPMVLEIAAGVIRLRVGRLGLLDFDESLLRRWLQTLGELGRRFGSLSLSKSGFDDDELEAVRAKMRWIGILGLLFAVALSVALFLILLVYLK